MKINCNREGETMPNEAGFHAHMYAKEYEMGMEEGCCPQMNFMPNETMPGVVCPPVYECPRETVCHRYICHEVPQE